MHSKKHKIQLLDDSIRETRIPPISEVYKVYAKTPVQGNLAKQLVDKAYFSSFPTAKSDASSALAALTMNSENVDELRECGSLGAIIEMLRKIPLPDAGDRNSAHIKNLVQSLFILTEDKLLQLRLLSNPDGIPCILRLCEHTSDNVQVLSFKILERLSYLDNGVSRLLDNHVLSILMTPALLYKASSTYVSHGSADMINRITSMYPAKFSIEKFDTVALDSNGTRQVDGYVEMQLLSATLTYFNHMTSEQKLYSTCLDIFIYWIREIVAEEFEDLDHLVMILKALFYISKHPVTGEYLVLNDLGVALQYAVRTDFEVWRKAVDPFKMRSNNVKDKNGKSNSKNPSKEIRRNAQLALFIIQKDRSTSRKYDDVNYIATKLAVQIYESVVNYKPRIIPDIVSSGLIPGLLFRVGKGQSKDLRFSTLVVHFIYLIIYTVVQSLELPESVEYEEKAAICDEADNDTTKGILKRQVRKHPNYHIPYIQFTS